MTPEFDPRDTRTLRAETERLSQELRRAIQRLENATLSFEDFEPVYRTEHQPKALALAMALQQHAPLDDPRRMMKTGDTFFSDEINMIKASLDKETARLHLDIVLKKLRLLTSYLPR